MTEALAQETAGEEIWINAVAPSVLDTPANRKAMPEADFASWVAPSAVAEVIAFLASPDNRVTRGAIIPVYGGAGPRLPLGKEICSPPARGPGEVFGGPRDIAGTPHPWPAPPVACRGGGGAP